VILDLHVHSRYSFDSLSRTEDILRTAKKKGLDGIAITDHGTIGGGLEARKLNSDPHFTVIVGAEIATEAGDIIGLFLEREVEARHCLDVIDDIHRQGGVAVLPHAAKARRITEEALSRIDVVEGFNSRASEASNRDALRLAEQYGKPVVCGSDAHRCSEIGTSSIAIDTEDIPDAIRSGGVVLHTGYSPACAEPLSQVIKCVKLRDYRSLPRRLAALALATATGRRP
jgi:predicted metal-dependent phosphoesterase TrpH